MKLLRGLVKIIKQLDRHLLDLAWSLWTELGVAGVIRNHQNELILLEELILFTSVLMEEDPRLGSEVIDWCAKFHRFVSISRLKSLLKDFEGLVKEPFSKFAATLNEVAKIHWPLLVPAKPLKIILSHKSILRPHISSALLNIRARSVFGAGSRADLITFFLVHPNSDFSIAEAMEMGYSKRSLADILEDLHSTRLFTRFLQGNQQRYRLNEESPLFQILQPIPHYPRPWRLVFKVFLSLRDCLKRVENDSETTQVVEIVNCLAALEMPLQKLGIQPISFANNFSAFIKSFNEWILEWASLLSKKQ